MYVVVFDDHPGIFGTFKTRTMGLEYIKEDGGKGRVVALITPWSLGSDH